MQYLFRFWKCNVSKRNNDEFEYTWKEWEMMNKDQESTIDIPGNIKFYIFFQLLPKCIQISLPM